MSAIAKNNVFYGAVEPIPINDGSTSATETWSGQYLNQEFSAINSTLQTKTANLTGKGITVNLAKSGNSVMLKLADGSCTAGAGETIVTVPTEYYPAFALDFRDIYSNKRIQLQIDGRLTCTEALSGTVLRGIACYITN